MEDMTDYKNIFINSANLLGDYEKINTMSLCDKYLSDETSPYLKNAYISALMLRYWKNIDKYYYKSVSLHIDKTDVLNWMFEAILCTLQGHVWTDPENKLYGDPTAFDKVFNRCLACSRYTAYQVSNRKKRKQDHDKYSWDQLKADYNDAYLGYDHAASHSFDIAEFDIIVKQFFDIKDYFKAFFIFGVLNFNMNKKHQYCEEKMRKFLLHVDRYAVDFAMQYKYPLEEVEKATKYVTQLGYSKINYKLKYHTQELRRFFS